MKQIIIYPKEFLEKLKVTQSLKYNNKLESVNNRCHITIDSGKLVVTTYNFTVGIQVKIDFDVQEDNSYTDVCNSLNSICVLTKPLITFIKNLSKKADFIGITFYENDNLESVAFVKAYSSSKSRELASVKLAGIDGQHFPKIPNVANFAFDITADNLIKISEVSWIGEDSIHNADATGGVLLEKDSDYWGSPNTLGVVATDKKMLGTTQCTLENDVLPEKHQSVIPFSAVNILLKTVRCLKVDKEDLISVYVDKRFTKVDINSEISVILVGIDSKYPYYRKLIDFKSINFSFGIGKKDLVFLLNQVEAFLPNNNYAITLNIRQDSDRDLLYLKAVNKKVGEMEVSEYIRVIHSNDRQPISFSVSHNYLLKSIKCIDMPEVIITFTTDKDYSSPILVGELSRCQYIIMPLEIR